MYSFSPTNFSNSEEKQNSRNFSDLLFILSIDLIPQIDYHYHLVDYYSENWFYGSNSSSENWFYGSNSSSDN